MVYAYQKPQKPKPVKAPPAPKPKKRGNPFDQFDGLPPAPRATKGAGTGADPVHVKDALDLHLASSRASASPLNNRDEPTDAQKDAGNYAKGHVKLLGRFDIAIENPKGSTRRSKATDAVQWESVMPAAYGYLKAAEGADGDKVDVYIGDNPESRRIYILDQIDNQTGEFDEHKVLMGFNSMPEAVVAYGNAFSDGKGMDRIGAITEVEPEWLAAWLKSGNTKEAVGWTGAAPGNPGRSEAPTASPRPAAKASTSRPKPLAPKPIARVDLNKVGRKK